MRIGAKVQITLILALALSLTYGAAKLMWPASGPPVICADEDSADCITNKDKPNTDYDPHMGEGFSPPPD